MKLFLIILKKYNRWKFQKKIEWVFLTIFLIVKLAITLIFINLTFQIDKKTVKWHFIKKRSNRFRLQFSKSACNRDFNKMSNSDLQVKTALLKKKLCLQYYFNIDLMAPNVNFK